MGGVVSLLGLTTRKEIVRFEEDLAAKEKEINEVKNEMKNLSDSLTKIVEEKDKKLSIQSQEIDGLLERGKLMEFENFSLKTKIERVREEHEEKIMLLKRNFEKTNGKLSSELTKVKERYKREIEKNEGDRKEKERREQISLLLKEYTEKVAKMEVEKNKLKKESNLKSEKFRIACLELKIVQNDKVELKRSLKKSNSKNSVLQNEVYDNVNEKQSLKESVAKYKEEVKMLKHELRIYREELLEKNIIIMELRQSKEQGKNL